MPLQQCLNLKRHLRPPWPRHEYNLHPALSLRLHLQTELIQTIVRRPLPTKSRWQLYKSSLSLSRRKMCSRRLHIRRLYRRHLRRLYRAIRMYNSRPMQPRTPLFLQPLYIPAISRTKRMFEWLRLYKLIWV